MSDKTPVRVTKQSHRFISEAKENLETTRTIQGFAESAVTKQISYLQTNLEGTDEIRELCEYLSQINGVDLPLPNQDINARLVSKDLNRRIQIDLSPEIQEMITSVQDCTELGRAKIIRLCILARLYNLSTGTQLFKYPKNEIIEDAWLPVKKTIDSIFQRMIYELHLQIVKQEEFLRNRIRRDQDSARRLQGYYENYFSHTVGHDRMMETHLGEKAISCFDSILATAVG
jgi:hypothetical protein